jgi:flagellar protein FlbD
MIRLTRLNQEPVAVNPDNILWVDAGANTVLCFVGGDKLMVRESLDELVARVLGHHQRVQHGAHSGQFADAGLEGSGPVTRRGGPTH